jgi:hypothetical protein
MEGVITCTYGDSVQRVDARGGGFWVRRGVGGYHLMMCRMPSHHARRLVQPHLVCFDEFLLSGET